MKNLFLTLVAVIMFIGTVAAECTVTTDCGTFTYDVSTVSVTASNGIITISSEGNVLDEITCAGTSVSSSCTGEDGEDGEDGDSGSNNGDFNICDYLPSWLAAYFGC